MCPVGRRPAGHEQAPSAPAGFVPGARGNDPLSMDRARWFAALVVGAALGSALLSPASMVIAQTDAEPESATDAHRVGRDLWRRDCAICHGESGAGTTRAPSIVGVGPAGVDFMVRTGRMPIDDPDDEVVPGEVNYTPAEIVALVDYVDTFLAGPGVPEVDVAGADLVKGGELYRLNCASCHQMAGQGGVLTGGTHIPPLGASSAVEVVEAMRSGPNEMPVFPEELIDARAARDIAAYVQEIRDPVDEGGWALGNWGPVPEGAAAFAFGLIPIVVVARLLGARNPPARQEDEIRD